MLKILIAGQGPSYRTKVKAALEQKAFKYVEADTGKETQLKIYAEKYLAILLDIDIRDHSFIYVIKYIQFNSPSMKIILTCQSKSQLNDMGLTVEEIKELGVADLIYAHFSAQQILNSIEGQVQFSSWRLIEKNETSSSPTEEVSPDSEFTKIPIANFFSGNATIFDLFLKLSSGRYLKIMNKGDFFEPEKIKQYKEEKKIDYLYFKTKDRVVYINFLSVLLEKLVLKPKVDSKFKLNLTQHLTEKFLEEAFVRGLNPQLFDDGNRVCSVIYNMVMQQKNLSKMVSSLEESIDSEFNHSFLLSFYASIICNVISSIGNPEKLSIM